MKIPVVVSLSTITSIWHAITCLLIGLLHATTLAQDSPAPATAKPTKNGPRIGRHDVPLHDRHPTGPSPSSPPTYSPPALMDIVASTHIPNPRRSPTLPRNQRGPTKSPIGLSPTSCQLNFDCLTATPLIPGTSFEYVSCVIATNLYDGNIFSFSNGASPCNATFEMTFPGIGTSGYATVLVGSCANSSAVDGVTGQLSTKVSWPAQSGKEYILHAISKFDSDGSFFAPFTLTFTCVP